MTASPVAVEPSRRSFLVEIARQLYLPIIGIITALLIGAVIILISGFSPLDAYAGLWAGSIGSFEDLSKGNFEALNGTLATSTPYIFTTLAVVFGIRAGLFNIGAEGQIKLGALCAAIVGINVGGLSPILAVPLTLAGGCLGGALWGALPGALKAWSGAHEVITTIMLNYIAGFITAYLVGSDGPLKAAGRMSQSEQIGPNSRVPAIFPNNALHWGIIIGVIMCVLVYWVLNKTPLGFEIRTVGANPSAARYAGINVRFITVITMTISGLLAGMGGALEVMGSPNFFYRYSTQLGAGYGFDSIAIALVAKNNPIAVIPAAFLFGALKHGASVMQFKTANASGQQLPVDLISIIQALVILFVAAEQVLRWLYRLRAQQGQEIVLTRGWGKSE